MFDPSDYEIIVRRVRPVPSWLAITGHWCLELWPNGRAAPAATLWLFEAPSFIYADYLYVEESFRRQGYATALLNAALARWPSLVYDSASDAGDLFLQSFKTQNEPTNN